MTWFRRREPEAPRRESPVTAIVQQGSLLHRIGAESYRFVDEGGLSFVVFDGSPDWPVNVSRAFIGMEYMATEPFYSASVMFPAAHLKEVNTRVAA